MLNCHSIDSTKTNVNDHVMLHINLWWFIMYAYLQLFNYSVNISGYDYSFFPIWKGMLAF